MIRASDVRALLLRAAVPPESTERQRKDKRFAAGYSTGFTHALEEVLEMEEEEE